MQKDPSRWNLVATTSVRIFYYQGMTHDNQGNFYFDGVDNGLWKTNSSLTQTGGMTPYIPAAVAARDKYNHIGAIAFAKNTGVLLPMECYNGTNCANTGAIGVADPTTLAWKYEVKLDPGTIKKAMWAAVSPNGKILWTSSENNLLAYDMADISSAHAWPAHAAIKPVESSRTPFHRPGSTVARSTKGASTSPALSATCIKSGRSTHRVAHADSRSPAPSWASKRGSTSSRWIREECTQCRSAATRPAALRRTTRPIRSAEYCT